MIVPIGIFAGLIFGRLFFPERVSDGTVLPPQSGSGRDERGRDGDRLPSQLPAVAPSGRISKLPTAKSAPINSPDAVPTPDAGAKPAPVVGQKIDPSTPPKADPPPAEQPDAETVEK